VNVGLISAIFGPFTTGPRETKFDLLFSKKKGLLKFGNIRIAIINEADDIITINVSTYFEIISRPMLLHGINVIILLIQIRCSFS
jgi:hypothetical protein